MDRTKRLRTPTVDEKERQTKHSNLNFQACLEHPVETAVRCTLDVALGLAAQVASIPLPVRAPSRNAAVQIAAIRDGIGIAKNLYLETLLTPGLDNTRPALTTNRLRDQSNRSTHHTLSVEYVAKYGLLCALELRLEAGRTSVGRGKSKAADEAAWRTECGRLGDSSVDRPPEFNLGHRGSWTAALAHWPLFIRKLCRAGCLSRLESV
ncbi:hypothetical protein AK812_SmicGene41412 [Symbiodinium microadriaticum]|uniref:Uncharacterized protein n=1 Tax=Symbiodinium microadriaticum TaxID=2951 RepID=A0A1Q9C663_SYMMI|nr:hypothetical protein AK812_SmicGene41412 [Symbiodinium microadriaticum]